MSIMQAMYAGSSALINFSEAMTVIGNNLANANTTAFKASTSAFEDVLIQTVGANRSGSINQVGTGVTLADVEQNMSQGAFIPTANVTDLSINGKGFFQVKDPTLTQTLDVQGRPTDTFFTRAGSFKKDLSGNLINSGGLVLQGYKFEEGVKGELGDINLAVFQDTRDFKLMTNKVSLNVNLNTDTAINTAVYDPNNPASWDFATSARVFDSKGKGHTVEIQFCKTADNTWAWHASVPTDELDASQQGAGDSTALDQTAANVKAAPGGATYAAGVLQFDSLGKLSQEGSTPLTFKFDGALSQEILFDFGDANGATGDSTNDYTLSTSGANGTFAAGTLANDANTGVGSIQMASASTTLSIAQDGYPLGFLDKLAVNADGEVVGYYTNGQTQKLYQVAMWDFADEGSLEQTGANLYKETTASGTPIEGTAKTRRFGSIVSNTLEQSNVDMSAEFVRMITTQRGFQANSRIVSVSDGMLEELIALKR